MIAIQKSSFREITQITSYVSLSGSSGKLRKIPCYPEAEGISGPTVRYKHTDFIAFMYAVTIR